MDGGCDYDSLVYTISYFNLVLTSFQTTVLFVVEVADEEFTIIKDFVVTKLGDAIDWESAPDDLKSDYTNVVQILNAYGVDQSQSADTTTAVAAPQ